MTACRSAGNADSGARRFPPRGGTPSRRVARRSDRLLPSWRARAASRTRRRNDLPRPPGRERGARARAQARSPLGRRRGNVHDARALFERHLVPWDHAVLDLTAGTQIVERPAVAQPDEVRARDDLRERFVRVPRCPRPTRRSRGARTRHRASRPRRRSPATSRASSSRSPAIRPAGRAEGTHEREGSVQVLIDAALRQLMLGERRATTRTPLVERWPR